MLGVAAMLMDVAFGRQALRDDVANLLLDRFDAAIRFLPDRP